MRKDKEGGEEEKWRLINGSRRDREKEWATKMESGMCPSWWSVCKGAAAFPPTGASAGRQSRTSPPHDCKGA